MKTIKSILLLAFAILAQTAFAQFSVTGSPTKVEPGDQFTLTIRNGSEKRNNISAFQTDIDLPNGLILIKVETGSGFGDSFTAYPQITGGGKTGTVTTMVIEERSMTGAYPVNAPWIVYTIKVAEDANPYKGNITFKNSYTVGVDGQESEVTIPASPQIEIYVPASDVTLNTSDLTMLIGQTYMLTATIKPDNTTLQEVSWTVEDNRVATVGADGNVTAVSAGTTTVTAKCDNVSATCTVTVKPNSAMAVTPGEGTYPNNPGGNLGEDTEKGGSLVGQDLTLRVNQTASVQIALPEGLAETPELIWSLTENGKQFVELKVNTDNTTIATFTGLAVGEADYSVKVNGATSPFVSAKVKVIGEIPVTALILNPATVSLAQNAPAYTITPVFIPGLPSITALIWESSDTAVVTVNENGAVKPVAVGNAIVTATTTDGTNLNATCQVTVTDPIDDNFELKFDEAAMGDVEGASIYLGSSLKLKPTPREDYVLPEDITWSSSDEKTVSVDQNGMVTGVALGEAVITASAIVHGQPVNSSCKVKVIPIPASSVTLDHDDITLLVGQSYTLTATVAPDDTTFPEINWISQDRGIAPVSDAGRVRAISVGTTTVTARCGEATAICKVTVLSNDSLEVVPGNGTHYGDSVEDPAENTEDGAALVGENLILRVGQSASLRIQYPQELTVYPDILWSLKDDGDNFVSIKTDTDNTATAIFTGLSVGETEYFATINGAALAFASGRVTVIGANPARAFEIEPTELTIAQNAPDYALQAIFTPAEAAVNTPVWTSSDLTVATVDGKGVVKPLAQGTTTITATTTDGTVLRATCEVTVTAPIEDSFELTFDEAAMGGVEGASIYIGESLELIPTAREGYELPEDISWATSDETIVTIDQNGMVTGVALGEATITAYATVHGNEVTATCKITVLPIALTGVTVSAESITILRDGQTVQLKAVTAPQNATEPIEITWESDKPEVATVDAQTGLVTAGTTLGKAIITATATNPSDRAVSASMEITVVATDASYIELSVSNLTLTEGESAVLTATVYPENTTDNTVKWESDSPEIATVSADGEVTAIAPGTVVITASCGEASASCNVTVLADLRIKSLSIDPEALTMSLNALPEPLKVIYGPEGAAEPELEWSSSASEVASVDENGMVTPHSVGTATITVTALDGSELSATCVVSITEPKPVLLGDANDNGIVTVSDAVAIANYIVGRPVGQWNFVNADVTEDGVIDVFDITATIRIIMTDEE